MFGLSLLANTFMPIQGTSEAGEVDSHYAFLLISALISFIILIGGMTFFIFKYKRKTANDKTAYITHNSQLEFLWSFIPFVIMMVIFYWGKVIYDDFRTVPDDPIEIQVTGRQWMWQFKYKNGYSFGTKPSENSDVVRVPINKPVKMILTSGDVLHSFYIPGFRNKQDAVPGKYSFVWFKATKLGDFQVFCTEFCGVEHSNMPATIRVMPEAEYNAWYNAFVPPPSSGGLADQGKELYSSKGCVACHSVDGKPGGVGPTYKGLYGSKKEFTDGSSVVADENYLRESILLSDAKIVKGYAPAMPIYRGQLEDEEVSALIDYIKSLK
jgi:cytochrome c oxidase subunit II